MLDVALPEGAIVWQQSACKGQLAILGRDSFGVMNPSLDISNCGVQSQRAHCNISDFSRGIQHNWVVHWHQIIQLQINSKGLTPPHELAHHNLNLVVSLEPSELGLQDLLNLSLELSNSEQAVGCGHSNTNACFLAILCSAVDPHCQFIIPVEHGSRGPVQPYDPMKP